MSAQPGAAGMNATLAKAAALLLPTGLAFAYSLILTRRGVQWSALQLVGATCLLIVVPTEPVVATTLASDSASAPVTQPTDPQGLNSEPPNQILKPAPTPEEFGVLGLDSIPPGAEVVWVTSSETVAEQARNNGGHPIVVMKEWHRSLRDHPVFRDVKFLWLIHPVWSNALQDREQEASSHLQASLEADAKIKSRLRWARANFVPAEAFR